VDVGTRPRASALALRAGVVLAILVVAAIRLLPRLVWCAAAGSARRPEEVAAATAARALVRLGPAFVKAGQLLSTRVDVMSPAACRALAGLYDRLPSMPSAAAARRLPADLLAALDGGADGLVPAAAGSIACVYRARLRVGGGVLAVKVKRPDVERIVERDLALLRATARIVGRAPGVDAAPLVEVVDQLAEGIRLQLDFEREAAALRRLRDNLAGLPGVRIPALVEAYCGPDVLAMEYVPGLRGAPAVPAPAGRTATILALRAVYHMLFLDGFVHCDLHPGNLYPMPDGSVVIVDAGFSRHLTPAARRGFAQFFYLMSRGDGPGCADVVLTTARPVRGGADPAGFRRSLARLVEENSRVAVADFNLVAFAVRLFAIQREHGYYADPQFVFPILSLIVLEGTLRNVCPDVDFQVEALPFVLRGLMT
jgi:ubiquinone biosynthesis protein